MYTFTLFPANSYSYANLSKIKGINVTHKPFPTFHIQLITYQVNFFKYSSK